MSKAKLYAQTLLHAQTQKTESEMNQFFDNFIAALKHKKEHKLLPSIVREFKALQERSLQGQETTLVVRDAQDAQKYTQVLAGHSDTFNTENLIVVEDASIVGGFIAKNSHAMLDKSYKRGLIDMYKRLVA